MNDKHLSEEEIQAMALDHGDSEPGAALHVSTCTQCRTAMENYRTLFAALEEQEKPVFDFDVSGLVLSQLPQSKQDVFQKYSLAILLITVTCLMAVFVFIIGKEYLVNLLSGYRAIFMGLILITLSGIFIFQMLETAGNYKKNIRALNNY